MLKALAETEEAQIVMLRSIYDLWKNHQQVCMVSTMWLSKYFNCLRLYT